MTLERRGFAIGELPREVYLQLKDIMQVEHATQRQVVVAGILALAGCGRRTAPASPRSGRRRRRRADWVMSPIDPPPAADYRRRRCFQQSKKNS